MRARLSRLPACLPDCLRCVRRQSWSSCARCAAPRQCAEASKWCRCRLASLASACCAGAMRPFRRTGSSIGIARCGGSSSERAPKESATTFSEPPGGGESWAAMSDCHTMNKRLRQLRADAAAGGGGRHATSSDGGSERRCGMQRQELRAQQSALSSERGRRRCAGGWMDLPPPARRRRPRIRGRAGGPPAAAGAARARSGVWRAPLRALSTRNLGSAP